MTPLAAAGVRTAEVFDPDRFHLPPGLEAHSPPEARGLTRDGVRLMVVRRAEGNLEHRRFRDLSSMLEAGDVLAVNTSATIPASLEGHTQEGQAATVNISGRLPGGIWVVELRHQTSDRRTVPWLDARPGSVIHLPDGGRVELRIPANHDQQTAVRLWLAVIELPEPPLVYLARHGQPIRYSYVPDDWPLSSYQTVFAEAPGSAEMPSAARPFSTEVITRLVTRGVGIAPFVLHCGVSSPESHEPPAAEWYHVPATTAAQINAARLSGHRVIAVGTTAVRALETTTDAAGMVHPGEGWTELVVTPDRDVRSADGLITGWHEPGASHLAMLEAIAGRDLVAKSYVEALQTGYLWHEFGDSHLILP